MQSRTSFVLDRTGLEKSLDCSALKGTGLVKKRIIPVKSSETGVLNKASEKLLTAGV
ncbi:MAG: hypothetical protein LBG87_06315 [Spirochaetaceae bacterium]|nr:hypothetical protein [Spirochaetaceae bacterium]